MSPNPPFPSSNDERPLHRGPAALANFTDHELQARLQSIEVPENFAPRMRALLETSPTSVEPSPAPPVLKPTTASPRTSNLRWWPQLMTGLAAMLLVGVLGWQWMVGPETKLNIETPEVSSGPPLEQPPLPATTTAAKEKLRAATTAREAIQRRIAVAQSEVTLAQQQWETSEQPDPATPGSRESLSQQERLATVLLESDRLTDRMTGTKAPNAYGCRLIVNELPKSSLVKAALRRLQNQSNEN